MAVCISGHPDDDNERKDDGKAAGEVGDLSRPPQPTPNMAIPVTRHVQMTEGEIGPRDWSFLACGVDSLDVGVYVKWKRWEHLVVSLENHRKRAEGREAIKFWETCLGPSLIYPGGKKPMYRFHVQVTSLHIFLQGQPEPQNDSPNVYVSFTSQTLWLEGWDAAIEQIHSLVKEWDGEVLQIRPSRIDLAADYQLSEPLKYWFLRNSFVGRTKAFNQYESDSQLETMYFGKKQNPVQLRIYDKALEIQKSLKIWFGLVWKVRMIKNIWRVEFQIRRKWLKQYGYNDINSLKDGLASIWRNLTTEWASLRLNDNEHTTRRTIHHWWNHVQSCADELGKAEPLERYEGDELPTNVEWYINHIGGCLKSYAALKQSEHLDDALLNLRTDLADLWPFDNQFEDEVRKRMIRNGDLPEPEGGDDVPF